MMVGLVACSSRKLDRAAPARELYQSTLFKLSVAWVCRYCDTLAILSAKYGVVLPQVVLEPYDETLVNMGITGRRRWGLMVAKQLREKFPNINHFTVMAGSAYMAFRPWLPGLNIRDPMAGLTIGRRLAWLKKELGT